MKEARYFYVPNAAVETELPAEEAVHAIRVLRLKEGDEMFLMDGEGYFYKAEVALVSSKKCLYTIKETLKQEPVWSGKIHLAIAPTKDMGRIEWMTEKATEVGFDEISFLDCKFSERKTLRVDRIEKIVISAVKQSRKGWKPVVNPMTPFRGFIENCSNNGRKFNLSLLSRTSTRRLLYRYLTGRTAFFCRGYYRIGRSRRRLLY